MTKLNYYHLTPEQRCKLDALKKAGHTQTFIAQQIGVSKSTVSREVSRNKQKRGSYSALYAQELANERKERFSTNRKLNDPMIVLIKEKLTKEQWSPEQIVGYCKDEQIDMVSHERIYQFVYQDKAEGGKLYKHLRVASKAYRKRYGQKKGKKQIIKNRISIDERSEIINNQERYGDWEIDTIIGKDNKGAIVTIVERKTGFILIKKLEGKNAKELAIALVLLMLPFKFLVRSITADNGTEFAEHEYIAKKLETDFYFAHPYSSWERGLSEYSNRLIRQYIPKKTDFKNVNHQYIRDIQAKLNRRPRKKLKFKTPGKIFLTRFEEEVALAS